MQRKRKRNKLVKMQSHRKSNLMKRKEIRYWNTIQKLKKTQIKSSIKFQRVRNHFHAISRQEKTKIYIVTLDNFYFLVLINTVTIK